MAGSVQYVTMSESGPDTVYIHLPKHPKASSKETNGCVKEMIRLDDVLTDRKIETMVNLDFDAKGNLIGIEVIL